MGARGGGMRTQKQGVAGGRHGHGAACGEPCRLKGAESECQGGLALTRSCLSCHLL